MGNRAIIKPIDKNIGIYLHWNGGRDSVEGFLKYCEIKEYRGLGSDTGYGLARLCQVIGNFFGGSTSLGIVSCMGTIQDAKMIDNGIYVVKDWKIVDRVWCNGKLSTGCKHAEQYEYDLQDMLEAIDQEQPEAEQLGIGYLRSELVPVSSLKIGDCVYVKDGVDGKVETKMVIGVGRDHFVNGINVNGIPYVDKYCGIYNDYASNINNYILNDTVRICSKHNLKED